MKVRLEPIAQELDCGPQETILDAAFRAGLNLVHGCREGQCSACKCFLLEGDVTLKPHSSFALSESEQAGGYTLMCRAIPEGDAVVELLHYDLDALRLAHPICDGRTTVQELRPLTHDISRVLLRIEEPAEFGFLPGQYVDLHVPGTDARRSFSIANLPGERSLELIVRRYPGGRFSGMLGHEVAEGSELHFTGPYGALRLRESEAPILLVAGGSGMAPVLALLRQLARERCPRPVRFFFGARREEDLFLLDEVARLGEQLPDFAFLPVAGRHVHEAVEERWELESPDAYLCGPPPMIEAVEGVLGARGVDPERVFADRFTTAAEADVASAAAASPPADEREFAWYAPSGRRRTLYEDVTVDTQPSVERHLTRGWPLHFADGRGTWDARSTALQSRDWFAFRDPAGQWERTFYARATALERALESATRTAVREQLLGDIDSEWREFLRRHLQTVAFLEHGLWFALATAGRDCLSDTVATCVCLQAAMKQRSAQAIVLHAMDLEPHLGRLEMEVSRRAWLEDPAWQPARAYVERLSATTDWGEVIVAANLCLEPTLGVLLRREVGIRAAAAAGDTLTPVLARAASEEWEWAEGWTRAFVQFALGEEGNREVLERWVAEWWPQAIEAAAAVAALAGRSFEADEPPRLEHEAPAAPVRRARDHQARAASRPSAEGEDWVGIVMARSAEGDAVADVLARREGVEVLEQPAFWEIRARERMAIPFAEVSAELGYAIDAYSIQHEMSTHYGRLVAGDEALLLFADPAEAMEHLLA